MGVAAQPWPSPISRLCPPGAPGGRGGQQQPGPAPSFTHGPGPWEPGPQRMRADPPSFLHSPQGSAPALLASLRDDPASSLQRGWSCPPSPTAIAMPRGGQRVGASARGHLAPKPTPVSLGTGFCSGRARPSGLGAALGCLDGGFGQQCAPSTPHADPLQTPDTGPTCTSRERRLGV